VIGRRWQRIEQTSRHAVQVNQGSLYPALHRLEMLPAWRAASVSPTEALRFE
jgi:hypothetical protein